MTTALWLLAIAVVGWAQRAFRARRLELRFRARFPNIRDGIIVGAEPRTYEGTVGGIGVSGVGGALAGALAGALTGGVGRAILLLHGYNDSPSSIDGVGQRLHAAGWTVRIPLLPGHGRSLAAFDRWTSGEVLAMVRDEYAALRARHRTVVVGGLSMGGALSCWLAAEADVDGLILFAPMLFVPRPMQVAVSTARLWTLVSKYIGGGSGRSIREPEARERLIAYGYSTRRSLEALEAIAEGSIVRLGFARAPTLIQQSAEDNRLPHDQSQRAFARLGTTDRTVHWVEGSGHVLTVDYGWEELAERTVAWLDARFGAATKEDAGRGTAV